MGVGAEATGIKEVDEKEVGRESNRSGRDAVRCPIPAIHVTTIVEQEEERQRRDEDVVTHESASTKGLIPA